MASDGANEAPGRDRSQADDLLTRSFRRSAIWIGIVTGAAAFVIFLLHSETPNDVFTLVGALGTGLVAGACCFLIASGIGRLIRLYFEGNRFHKAAILVASLAAIVISSFFAWNGGWLGIIFGLILGVFTCGLILAAANVTAWVISGFQHGKGYRRLAVVLVLIAVFSILGCYGLAKQAFGDGLMILLIWWAMGSCRGREGRLSAGRVGWFMGLAAWIVATDAMRRGRLDVTRSQSFPWDVFVAIGVGLAAWGITLFLAPFFADPGKTSSVEKCGEAAHGK
jgi:hypothetical protein